MKKKLQKLIGVLIAAALALSLSVPAFAAELQPQFGDIAEDAWYSQAVAFTAARGLMIGTGNGNFSPDMTLDRAMFAAILHRLAGSPDAAGENSFSDVPDGLYYTDAVNWAVENNIVFGTSETTFSPLRDITREEMACMIARYVTGINAEFLDGADTETYFSDQASVSGFAVDSVELMRKTGLFQGDDTGTFRPQAAITRAETATVIMRLTLKLHELPEQAVLARCDDGGNVSETLTLSAEDTTALYLLLTDSKWDTDDYAEYVPTHILTLGDEEYLFSLTEYTMGHHSVNYKNGNTFSGIYDPDGLLISAVWEILTSIQFPESSGLTTLALSMS